MDNLVFLDEAGVNLWMVRLFARAVQGQRAYGSRPKRKGKNVSLFDAISLKGVVAQTSLIGTTDGITFEAFVSQKLVPNLWEGACAIMDNCSARKGEEVRKMIEAAGAKLIYLPPYSPDFSPIEHCWSKVKNIRRSLGARTYKDLLEAIEYAVSQVTLGDIQNWLTHCRYCTSPA